MLQRGVGPIYVAPLETKWVAWWGAWCHCGPTKKLAIWNVFIYRLTAGHETWRRLAYEHWIAY